MADQRTGRPYRRARAKLKQHSTTCILCGQGIDTSLTYPDPMSFSAHHTTPYALGGGTDTIAPTHLICNQIQGDSTTPIADRHSSAWY